jgi:hypothetical protein
MGQKKKLSLERNCLFKCSERRSFGNIEALRAALARNGPEKRASAKNCPWNEDTCLYAEKGGHLEILKWARDNGCPSNEKIYTITYYNNLLELLKCAKENGSSGQSPDDVRASLGSSYNE